AGRPTIRDTITFVQSTLATVTTSGRDPEENRVAHVGRVAASREIVGREVRVRDLHARDRRARRRVYRIPLDGPAVPDHGPERERDIDLLCHGLDEGDGEDGVGRAQGEGGGCGRVRYRQPVEEGEADREGERDRVSDRDDPGQEGDRPVRRHTLRVEDL